MRLTIRSLFRTLGATTVLAALVVLVPVARVAADEGGDGITLRAPLDAVDCAATPPTITVLGLVIDVSTATFDGEGGDGEGDGGNGGGGSDGGDGGGGGDFHTQSDHQEGDGGGDGGGGNASGGCAALAAGQLVAVAFANDTTPLVATHVRRDGGDDGDVEIKAPLQAVDSTLNTLTLLGLTIDASTAEVHGNDGEGDHLPTDLSQMTPGQLAEVRLDAAKLPALVATEVDVQIDSVVVLQAPLDAVNCTATPPTITVLGLTIDVGTATFGGRCDGGGDGGHDDEEDGGNGGDGCAALVPGALVHVVLMNDTTPLVASQVKQGGEDEGAEIKAPLQAFDSGAQTVTLLGLAIDASGAGLDGGSPPIDFTKLTVGQVAEAHLDGTKLPTLVATGLQVTNVGSDIDVEVDDPSGAEIDDPSADVSIDVTETVTLRRAGTRGKPSTTTVHLHSTGHGSFRLSGLPAGSAKISVTRVRDGIAMARSHGAHLKTNKVQTLRLRLRRMR